MMGAVEFEIPDGEPVEYPLDDDDDDSELDDEEEDDGELE
jgi:hypothetical protein